MSFRAARWGCALLLLVAPGACSSDNPASTSEGPTTGSVAPSASSPSASSPLTSSTAPEPRRWDHVVVAIMSSRSYADVIGDPDAPYVNLLARSGATFLDAHAVARPAAPNYFALFAGWTYGLTGDSCPHRYRGPNLATQLAAQRDTFASYAESLPKPGSRACHLNPYTTAHNAAASFANVPSSTLRRATGFDNDFESLPSVSFLIPNRDDSMATDVRTGDSWLRTKIAGYAAWATSHRSLLVITWDQGRRGDPDNHIPMIAIGAGVTVGPDAQRIDHYALLATIQDGLGLARLANTAGVPGIAALGG